MAEEKHGISAALLVIMARAVEVLGVAGFAQFMADGINTVKLAVEIPEASRPLVKTPDGTVLVGRDLSGWVGGITGGVRFYDMDDTGCTVDIAVDPILAARLVLTEVATVFTDKQGRVDRIEYTPRNALIFNISDNHSVPITAKNIEAAA